MSARLAKSFPKAAKSRFIKSIINYSVGVMGFNPAKQITHGYARITTNLPAIKNVEKYIFMTAQSFQQKN